MDITTAAKRIKMALKRMGEVVGEPVFDEWALTKKTAKGWQVLGYVGPRKEAFVADFAKDVAALRETLDPSETLIGDFAFSHEGFGSGFDAHICAGENLFVLLNNTGKSTGEITSNSKWKTAQIHFSLLVESFISDPVA
jgi:hypothetical protein